jgi:hypothetical protein
VTAELRRWSKRAKERHDIDLKWTPQLVESLTQVRIMGNGAEQRIRRAARQRDEPRLLSCVF